MIIREAPPKSPSSDDGTAKLWNVSFSPVIRVSFNPDGKTLASAGMDKTVKLWYLERNLDTLMRRGCLWLRDYLATHPQKEAIREICRNW